MRLKKFLSAIFIIFIFGILFVNIFRNWHTISSYPWQINPLKIWLLIIFLIPVYLVNGLSWYFVNRSMGSKLTYFQALRVLMLGNFSRFIPGGIWQYAGRIFLAQKIGIARTSTAVAILTETVLTLLIGVGIIFVIGIFWKLPVENKSLVAVILLLGILIGSIFVLGNKKLLSLLPIKFKAIKVPLRWLPLLILCFSMQFIFDGTVLFFLANMAVPLSGQIYPVFIGIFAASWLLGFITILAPSGLGVQEFAMAALLATYMPLPIAMVVAISFRLLLITSEVLLILLILLKEKID